MKPLLLLSLIAGLFFSCGTGTQEKDESESAESENAVESRYSYSNTFELGEESYKEIVRNWNNALVAGDIDQALSYAADSLYIFLSDGSSYNADKDSIKSFVSGFLEGVSNLKVEFIAGMSVISSPQGENWVLSYTDESWTDAEGDHRAIAHELYQFVDGKIRTLYAFAQTPTEFDIPAESSEEKIYSYSGSFEIMDNQNVEILEGWIDALMAKDWEAARGYLADSVTVFFSNGSYMNDVADSLIALGKDYFEGATVDIEASAAMSVRSTDLNEDWVLMWFTETNTKEGETIKTDLHEAYMIVDGKIRVARAFARPALEEGEEAGTEE